MSLVAGTASCMAEEPLIKSFPRREKNWMGFFPGPNPDARQTLPTFHYSLVPARILHPPNSSADKEDGTVLSYALEEPRHSRASCIADKLRAEVPNTGNIHHATPPYRFTLCARTDPRCIPDEENTVMIGIGQVKVVHSAGQRYRRYVLGIRGGMDADGAYVTSRFFVVWNVTEPFEYLAVGPLFRWRTFSPHPHSSARTDLFRIASRRHT